MAMALNMLAPRFRFARTSSVSCVTLMERDPVPRTAYLVTTPIDYVSSRVARDPQCLLSRRTRHRAIVPFIFLIHQLRLAGVGICAAMQTLVVATWLWNDIGVLAINARIVVCLAPMPCEGVSGILSQSRQSNESL